LRAGPFDVRLRNTEDWEMWIRLAKQGRPSYVRSPLLAYRVHGQNSSLDVAEIVRGARLIEELHQTRADWGRLHRFLADSCLRRGQRRAAASRLARAAVTGQFAGVASDIGSILRRRLSRTVHTGGEARTSFSDPWTAEAAEWLLRFETQGETAGQPNSGSAAVPRSGHER
jgi:hypothetical protein